MSLTMLTNDVLAQLGAQRTFSTLELLVSSSALALVAWTAYSFFFSPVAHIPGPLLVRLGLDPWVLRRAINCDMAPALERLHDKYGLVVRIGKNHVSCVDPEAIPMMYRTKGGWEKTNFYFGFRSFKGDSVMTLFENKPHAELRRIMDPAFNPAAVKKFHEYIDPVTDKFFDLVERNIKDGKATMNMSDALQWYSMDVIGEIAYGRSFNMLNDGEDPMNLLPLVRTLIFAVQIGGSQPWLFQPLFPILGRLSKPSLALNTVTEERVAERIKAEKQGTARPDLLTRLIECKNTDGSPFSHIQVENESSAIIGAASDTTSIAMRAMIYFLVKHPQVYEKLQQELDEALEDGRMHLPIDLDEANKLPYLQAVIKETLRCHPPISWPLPRYVPKGGASVGGYVLSEGTTVGIGATMIQRREEVFGPDAKMFRPERWIEASTEQKLMFEKCMMTFGNGVRICIGRHLAYAEINKLLPTLIYKYQLSFTPRGPSSPHKEPGRSMMQEADDEEPWSCEAGWITTPFDFWCDLKPRVVD